MKKFFTIFLTIILTLTMILITISYSAENIVVNTLSSELTYKKVSGKILDFVIDYDMNKLDGIDNTIKNSKQLPKITKKLLNATIENISYNKNTVAEISDEINNLLNNELSNNINEEKRNEIIIAFKNYGNELENEFERYLSGFSYNYTELFKIYYTLVSKTFRIILFTILCISIIVLILLKKLKVMSNLKIASLITFVVSTIILITTKLLQNYIDQNFAGGRLNNLNTISLIVFVIIWLLLSVIFIVSDKKMKNN